MEDMMIIIILLLFIGFYWNMYVDPKIYSLKQKISGYKVKLYSLISGNTRGE